MGKLNATDEIIHLLLPEREYWCRSVLPGIAHFIRIHTGFFLRNHDHEESLELAVQGELPPAGVIAAFLDSRGTLAGIFRKKGIPAVIISGRQRIKGIPQITHDNFAVGRLAAEHLLEKGYRNFAVVGAGDNPMSNDRCRGFVERLVRDDLMITNVDRRELAGDIVRFRDWLEKRNFPLGIFAVHDRCGRKVCWEAERLGFRIPDDIGVVGVDNDPYQCEMSRTPLSSIALNFEKLGYLAGQQLYGMIRGENSRKESLLVSPQKVFERTSTDFLAIPDKLVRNALQEMKRPRDGRRLEAKELAKILSVSKSLLEKRFKAATGKTLYEEIHRFRMERARQLVDETRMLVDDIGERIGISDGKRFVKLFKERFGETPFQRRKRMASF